MKLADTENGMILMTGTAGSGKSTTQACIIDRINRTRDCHIITLEDPIEFLHRNQKSIVSQREIAIDTVDYLAALRSCLRQAPDVILLGEMRDAETIRTAITAAETGHLVFATLHTNDSTGAINRILDSFDEGRQLIRTQLAEVLQAIVCQELLPKLGGRGRVANFEVLIATPALRSLIREGRTHQIASYLTTGKQQGMLTKEEHRKVLQEKGLI